MMKAVHTILINLGNPKNDRQVARVIANWTITGEGRAHGEADFIEFWSAQEV
jgi:hypothetical protein